MSRAASYSDHALKILQKMWDDGLYDDRSLDDFIAAIADLDPRMVTQWYHHKRFECRSNDLTLPVRVPYVDRKVKQKRRDQRMRGVGSGRGPRTAYSPEQTSILTIALNKGYLDDKTYVELTARLCILTRRQVGQWRNNRRFQNKQKARRRAQRDNRSKNALHILKTFTVAGEVFPHPQLNKRKAAAELQYLQAAKRQRTFYPIPLDNLDHNVLAPPPSYRPGTVRGDRFARAQQKEVKLMTMLHSDVKQGIDMQELSFVMQGAKLSPAIQLILERAYMNNMTSSPDQQKIVATLAGITEYDVRSWCERRANGLLARVKPTEVDLLSSDGPTGIKTHRPNLALAHQSSGLLVPRMSGTLSSTMVHHQTALHTLPSMPHAPPMRSSAKAPNLESNPPPDQEVQPLPKPEPEPVIVQTT